MRLSRRARTKALLAVGVGIPGTVLFLPFVLWAIVFCGFLLAASFTDRSLGRDFGQLLLTFLWGVGGLAGLVAFWRWVFLPRVFSETTRLLIVAGLLVGVCSVLPVVFGALDIHWAVSLLAAVAAAVGALIAAWLVLPNLPLNPDARQEHPRAG